MDGFVISFRIIADIPGGIGKPVGIISLGKSQEILHPWDHLSHQHIVHISRQTDSGAGQQAAQRRRPSRFGRRCLPRFGQMIQQHLPHQGKRQHKGKGRHKGSHDIIRLLHPCAGELCEKYGEILTAVIVVDGPFTVPEIPGRQRVAAHHGHHKSVVHEFLRPVGRRTESREVGPQKEKQDKQQLSVHHGSHMPLREHSPVGLGPHFSHPETQTPAGHAGDDSRPQAYIWPEGQQAAGYGYPGQKSRKSHAQHFGYHPTPVREIPEQQGRQGIAGHPQKHRHQPPFQKYIRVLSQKPDTSCQQYAGQNQFCQRPDLSVIFHFLPPCSFTTRKNPRVFLPVPIQRARPVSYFSGLTPPGFQRVFLRFRKSRTACRPIRTIFFMFREFFPPLLGPKKMG